MIEARQIGTTGMSVSAVSFGGSALANLYRRISDADADELMRCAWGRGIRYFDTAPHYGRGRSEMRLGNFLSNLPRDGFVLSTKVGRVLRPGSPMAEADGFIDPLPNAVHYDYSGMGIRESVEGSLKRLKQHRIDIIYVHDIGRLTHGSDNQAHLDQLLSSGLPELEKMRATGLIGAIGLGVNETEVCLNVLSHHALDVILLAGRWTLLDRSAESELVPVCRASGVSLVLGGILNSGILATGAIPSANYDYGPAPESVLAEVRSLENRCRSSGVSLATAALRFALSRPGVASILIGTGKAASLNRNLDAIESVFPDELGRDLF